MARRPSKAAAKTRRSTSAASVAAVLDAVEAQGRPRRVPGRKLAVVPLADLRRMRQLERAAEDREDREIIAAAARRPDAYSDWDDAKARLLGWPLHSLEPGGLVRLPARRDALDEDRARGLVDAEDDP